MMKNYINLLLGCFLCLFFLTNCEVEDDENPVFESTAVPRIFGWSTANTYTTDISDSLIIDLQVSPAQDATFKWFVDGVEVGTGLRFKYLFPEAKDYTIKFEATRNGVTNSREADVIVIKPFVPKTYNKKMVGFLTQNGSINDVNFANLTHLVISSAVVGEVAGQASLVDTTLENLNIPLIIKAAHNAGVYVLLDVTGNMVTLNGGGMYADYGFFNVVKDPAKQATAIATIMKFASNNGFDGINVYLNNTSEGVLEPVSKIEQFFKAIPAALPPGPNGKFFYTASVPGGWTTGVLSAIAKVPEIDWVNIQPYRYEDLAPTAHSPYWGATDLVNTWVNFGLPKEKIVLGFPAFGLHYNMPKDGTQVGWGNLWKYATYESFRDILLKDPMAHTKNMLAVDDGIYYDGHPIIQQKAQLVIDQGLGGLMMWSVESDTPDQSKSLLKAANTALGN
ncbi:hypothetical protein FOA19_05305 [Rufibacter hautae]|uniref:chitinase n=1 Tax=Rufibacter hautae TaxID=2595005 RepID=A0A5B6TL15_9BACT|nr:hypothetical protein FOA19_05305 [Rufibacter hautae]